MPDMLVKLYELPDQREALKELQEKGIYIRRAFAPDKHRVLDFVSNVSTDSARSEADVAFSHQPISLFIATKEDQILGFACYDATLKNYFGPTAVLPEYRGQGIGKALLIKSLEAMYNEGYGYAIFDNGKIR